MSVDISFLNISQNCCSSLLDYFVVIKRQRQSFLSSRETFHDYSHMIICSLIGFQFARCEDISVTISLTQNAGQSDVQAFWIMLSSKCNENRV